LTLFPSHFSTNSSSSSSQPRSPKDSSKRVPLTKTEDVPPQSSSKGATAIKEDSQPEYCSDNDVVKELSRTNR